jgi:hypothetical protein
MQTVRNTQWEVSLIYLSLLFLVGCSDIPSEYKPFFRLPPDQQEKEIFNYSLDQQIDLVVLRMTVIRPPGTYLGTLIARNGEKLVPLLLSRLSTVENEPQLGAILYCLLEIDLRHYEWKNDPKYVPLLQQELAKMTDSALRQEATRALLSGAASHSNFEKRPSD